MSVLVTVKAAYRDHRSGSHNSQAERLNEQPAKKSKTGERPQVERISYNCRHNFHGDRCYSLMCTCACHAAEKSL